MQIISFNNYYISLHFQNKFAYLNAGINGASKILISQGPNLENILSDSIGGIRELTPKWVIRCFMGRHPVRSRARQEWVNF